VKVFKGSLVLYREADFTVLFPSDPVPHSVGDFFAFHAKLVKPTWPWRCAKAKPEEVSSVSKVPLVTNPTSGESPLENDEYESWVSKLMVDPEALQAHAEKSESWTANIDTEITWTEPEAPKTQDPTPETPVSEETPT